ncbi:MAG: ADOP family duplicated permease [Candidatus Acidiferrales bacterium]
MHWLTRLLRKSRAHRQLDSELRFHLERQIADYIASGMRPDEARRRARLDFGGLDQVKEQVHAAHRGYFLETLLQDIRYGLRMLRKSPGFTAVAIITLALGICANTAIFSVVDAVLLRSLPYPDADRLVVLSEELPRAGGLNVSLPDFLDWRAQNRSFDQMAAFAPNSFTLTGSGEPTSVRAGFVSWSFFPLLGVKPLMGRTFTESEDKPGATFVAVISYSLWRSRLKEDPHIIGKPIMLDGYNFEVVGVLPPGFAFPGLNVDVYDQIGPMAAFGGNGRGGYADRSNHPGIRVLARLRSRTSLAAARSDMGTIMARLGMEYPKSDRGERAIITPLYDEFLGWVQPSLVMLTVAAAFVLLLACVNVAGLLFARSATREREIAVRAALGAGRARLFRQLLTESAVLSLLGAGAGLALAHWTMRPLLHLAPASVPNLAGVHLNSAVLAFTLAVALLTAVLSGLAPGVSATRIDLDEALKSDVRAAGSPAGSRFRSTLLVVEIAAAVVIVIGAGLIVRSLSAAVATYPGFDPEHVLALDVILSGPNSDAQHTLNFFDEVLQRIRHLPGVLSAGAAMQPPVAGLHWTSPYVPAGQVAPPVNQQPWTALNMVTPGYFETMRTPVLQGRIFTDSDNDSSRPVAVVNETMARKLDSQLPVIGKLIHVQYAAHPLLEIVGVVHDMKQFGLEQPDMPEVYVPAAQMAVNFMTIVVRGSGDPSALAHPVAGVIQNVDKGLPLSHVVPMTQYIETAVSSRRFAASLSGAFAVLALILAAIGIYGTISYSVARRMHEFGIRMALGASRSAVLTLVLGRGLVLVAFGLAIGIAGAIGLTRDIASELYGVTPTDPATFVAVALLLALVALLACYIPARRATRVDPVIALRHE